MTRSACSATGRHKLRELRRPLLESPKERVRHFVGVEDSHLDGTSAGDHHVPERRPTDEQGYEPVLPEDADVDESGLGQVVPIGERRLAGERGNEFSEALIHGRDSRVRL